MSVTSSMANRKRSLSHQLLIDTSVSDPAMNTRQTRHTRHTISEGVLSSKRPRKNTIASCNSSENGDNVRLTKTGRVSKALKGQPVHKCDVCLKCYTRAEHLRRHALSHRTQAQDATSQDTKPRRSPSRLSSVAPEDLARSSSDPAPFATTAPSVFPELASPWPFPSTAAMTPEPQFTSSYEYQHEVFGTPSLTTTRSTPSMDSCSLFPPPVNNYPPQPVDQWWQVKMPSTDTGRSISPASLSCSSGALAWSVGGFGSPPISTSSFSSPPCQSLNLFENPSVPPQSFSLIDLDEQDTARIDQSISTLAGMANDGIGHSTLWLLEHRYEPLFWQYFNANFPIIHRGTFFASLETSVLLKALVIAIGASFSGDCDAALVANTLFHATEEALEHHDLPAPAASKTQELQIVFLAEAFATFRSSSRPHGLSPRFQALLSMLQFERSMDSSHNANDLMLCDSSEASTQLYAGWVDSESRHRLLLACYVLETQYSALLDQPRDLSSTNMMMPCASSTWETQDINEWQTLVQQQPTQTPYVFEALDRPYDLSCDPFTATIVGTLVHNSRLFITPSDGVLSVISSSPQSEFSYHSLQLVNHCPVKNMLAVAGQSFAFEEKLSSMVELEQTRANLVAWSKTDNAGKALYHAAHMLRISLERGSIGLMHEEWSLYLAALVSWTKGVWGQRHIFTNGDMQIPCSDYEIQEDTRSFVSRYGVDGITPTGLPVADNIGARACVVWTLRCLEQRYAGSLMNEARHVLSSLLRESV